MKQNYIKSAQFLKSAPSLIDCPLSNLNEAAIIGRSNVGKSTFINTFANNSKLAKTSNKPGKTKLINFYIFENIFLLADLPGYGFANVDQKTQNDWQQNLEKYLLNRKNLQLLIQFIDSRHNLQKNDKLMYDWIVYNNLNHLIVLSKIDLIPKNKINNQINYYSQIFKNSNIFPFSTKYTRFNYSLFDKIFNILSK